MRYGAKHRSIRTRMLLPKIAQTEEQPVKRIVNLFRDGSHTCRHEVDWAIRAVSFGGSSLPGLA